MAGLLSRFELERLAHPERSEAACVRAVAARVIDELGITNPPVNVGMVASLLDIGEIIRDKQLDVAGCLVCGATSATVMVRASDSESRQRFTICHECAHTFFPGFRLATQFRCSPTVAIRGKQGVEHLCDEAASELLLPQRLFCPMAYAEEFSLHTVEELAKEFRASLAATATAFVTNATEPVAVLTFEVMQKPTEYGTLAEPKLRVRSSVTRGTWPFFPRYKSVDANDPFDRANQGEIVSEIGYTLGGIVSTPVDVELHAQKYPYFDGTDQRERVIALLRQTTHRLAAHG